MPAAPVHHTGIDKTNAWDGPAAEKAFDKVKGDFPKFYAWIDEGESDSDADGTDKEDGWGPHHDVDDKGIPGDANEKGFEAAMAALNGAHGGNSVIPDADRQGVWDHLAAHYRDAGVDDKDIPKLAARSASTEGEMRADSDTDPGTIAKGIDAALDAGAALLDGEDLTQLPATVQQAIDLFLGAGQGSDNLLSVMNVVDPDEPNEDDANRSTVPAQPKRDEAPKESLIRARIGGLELRDAPDGNGSLMFGHFSVFNNWYEIDSFWEGTFLERTMPGAFADTIRDDASNMRVLYDHGFDPQLGNKPLGPIAALREDDVGAYYEVPLLDTDYNRNFVLPALRGQLMNGEQTGSLLGASFRFMVTGETWDRSGTPTSFNPQGLPLRSITRTQVLEFGPVTFPANAAAGAGVRSRTDDLIEHLRSDPLFVARFTARHGVSAVERMLEAAHPERGARHEPTAQNAPSLRQAKRDQLRRRAQAVLVLNA